HPERPERLDAVLEGIDTLDLGDDLVRVEPRPATRDELITVHEAGFVDALHEFCAAGGGHVDRDTRADEQSWEAAVLAAGSMRRSAALAPQGRCVAFLEGGYDLDALGGAAEACVGALVGIDRRPEPPTSGGPGLDVVEAAADLRSS
ncbi:MAG TPA: hypothetical protein VHG90_00885, partial [Acidimicrobiales bacterium]|nr:hypothetical protein [Acidimicrobiales bacterium]